MAGTKVWLRWAAPHKLLQHAGEAKLMGCSINCLNCTAWQHANHISS